MGRGVPVDSDAETLCGETTHDKDAGYYEFQWHHEWMKVTKNPNGTTGWATIIHSTNAAVVPKTVCRIHLCAFNPCKAWHPTSKYGLVGEPIHLRSVERRDSSALAEPIAAPTTAVADTSLLAAETSLPAPVAAAVADSIDAPPPTTEPELEALAPVKEEPALDPAVTCIDVPDCPKEASLHTMQAPGPTSPKNDMRGASCDAVAPSTAVAAQHALKATLLALARAIRRPREYVGYSAFLLMGLLKKCQPTVWEGSSYIDLLEVFAPWAKERCTELVLVSAIPVALVANPDGSVALAPICAEYPLTKTCHYVAGLSIPACEVSESACSFEALYASLGVGVMTTVLDGDCGLEVMTMMLGIPSTPETRNALRIEISDYLLDRLEEAWLHDLMVVCQELRHEDVVLYRTMRATVSSIAPVAPVAPSPAVADIVATGPVTPDAESLDAMRWASKLDDDSCVLSLIRSLPAEIVQEQVLLYRGRDETALAEKGKVQEEKKPIAIGRNALLQTRMMVVKRFHEFCQENGIDPTRKLPYGALTEFRNANIICTSQRVSLHNRTIRDWYSQLVCTAVADGHVVSLVPSEKCKLRSRAPVTMLQRRRAPGAGARFKATPIREALYEWFTATRYAVDWSQLISESRSRGKKHLARFPRSILRLKVQQFIQEYTYACLLNGEPVVTFKADSWWFKRWQEEYGLSMRKANRKYAVPRAVVKERMEIFWVVLFRVRLLIYLSFGYEALILNFDQSPYHHNESGSQNHPVLAVTCSTVPVVEGNSDVKSRWTANLTTQSRFNADDQIPAAECMFKAERDGRTHERLQAFLRSRGFPPWFTVTVGPKGSYREHDIISWLTKHLEPWKDGRDWRIYLCDDYAAHKTDNVWNLCWSRGYVRITHGGGVTPYAQTPDTDLNEHVRRTYGKKESRLLLDKMKDGQVVPKLTHEECMEVMYEVLNDRALHVAAAQGYKKVGQSIDLYGAEDELVCREAGVFWKEETTDKYASMRQKLDQELAAVADEFKSSGITWCERDVLRLISPYPKHAKVDRVIENLGEDAYNDDLQGLDEAPDDPAVADSGEDEADCTDASDNDPDAVADDVPECAEVDPSAEGVELAVLPEEGISADDADAIHKVKATISALEGQLEGLRAIGSVRMVQHVQTELDKQHRRARELIKISPAVADSFLRLRRAEDEERLTQQRIAMQHKKRKREASNAVAERNAAVAELRETKRRIQEMESIVACRYAIKTFTLEAMGDGAGNAGGAKARKNRFDVLDRLSRVGAGLSPGQKNDWLWFKEAWDKAMAEEHGAAWASLFAKWMQSVLDDDSSNAFSSFVYRETCRVFHGTVALHVPGV